MSNLFEMKNITAGYDGKVILEDVNMSIFEGDFIGVVGPNGGGKTTLMKLILGQIKPFLGEMIYGDKLNHIGYLPQVNDVDKNFPITIEEIVLSGMQLRRGFWGRYSNNDKAMVREVMAECGISHLANRTPSGLSGGELQRAYLCRAIISSPSLLILDEPSTYVDSKFEKELYELLKELNRKMAILMVSHDLGTITSYVKSIACVNRTLHYHNSNVITTEQLAMYECPILLVAHGDVPHTVLHKH